MCHFKEEPEFCGHPQTPFSGWQTPGSLWHQPAFRPPLLVWRPQLQTGLGRTGHSDSLCAILTLNTVFFPCFLMAQSHMQRNSLLKNPSGSPRLQEILKHVSKREFEELMCADQLTRERHKRKAFLNFSGFHSAIGLTNIILDMIISIQDILEVIGYVK